MDAQGWPSDARRSHKSKLFSPEQSKHRTDTGRLAAGRNVAKSKNRPSASRSNNGSSFNMNPLSLAHLHGQSVLVKSAQDRHDPSIALRGSLDTMTVPGIVKVVLQYPDMCIAPAHQGIINLDARTVDLLLEEGPEGPYTITVQESIDPEPPTSTPRAIS